MASVVALVGSLGLLLVSVLPEVLGDRPSPDRRAHSGDAAQVGPGATETRRRPPPPPKNQHERAWAGALPLGALYTAAAVAFVLYKYLQVRDDQGWGCPELESPTGALWYQEEDTFSRQSVK
ncbi:coiled-coil domain-containing protein, partial [Eschrichtius robustus]|nr:coiled-coil domain-containing protein [Eschrichtius robustus]